MNKTGIEWCDVSWNPVTGCYHGCTYCYAESIARRFRGFEPRCGGEVFTEEQHNKFENGRNSVWLNTHGEKLHIFDKQPQKRTKAGKWQKASYPYEFEPTLHRYRLDEPQKAKKSQSIFVCSMADLFGNWVPDSWIEEVFEACAKAPQHTYIFLTKNPLRYYRLHQSGKLLEGDNYWYGMTITRPYMNFEAFDGYNCFVSYEPMENQIYRSDIPASTKLLIIGAETGNRKDKFIPDKRWSDYWTWEADHSDNAPALFMKNSLVPIVGEENMRRELPWEEAK